MRIFKTTAFRYIIATLLLLTVIFIILQPHGKPSGSARERHDDELRCCIAIESKIASLSSRGVGFSYELLNYYADDSGLDISFAAYENKSVWDSLVSGNIDILIFDYDDDSTSAVEYGEDVMLSVPLRNNICAAVGADEGQLLNSFNFWLSTFKDTRTYVLMKNRYFRSYRIESLNASGSGNISPYDDIIRQYSKFSGLDWLLVSAVTYQESHYYMGASSGSAQGLMQIKPGTAARYGVQDVYDPELNIKAGTLHLQYLMRYYREDGLDSLNVIKFALAAYNAGEARIEQCRVQAAEDGYNPDDWEDVARSLSGTDSFVGRQTVNYVDEILSHYNQYKELMQ